MPRVSQTRLFILAFTNALLSRCVPATSCRHSGILRSCFEYFRTAVVPWYWCIYFIYISLCIVHVSEHGHSHSHGHSHGDKGSGPLSVSHATPAGTDNMPMQIIAAPVRGRTGSYSSMYGHPAATRAAVTQAAQDMAIASPSRHLRNTSTSSRSIRVAQRVSLEVDITETPHLHCEQDKTKPSTVSSPPSGHSHGHSHGSMNMRALMLHVMGDALGNVGVIVTGLVIWLTTWSGRFYLDPAVSLIIAAIIFTSALPLGKSHFIREQEQNHSPTPFQFEAHHSSYFKESRPPFRSKMFAYLS